MKCILPSRAWMPPEKSERIRSKAGKLGSGVTTRTGSGRGTPNSAGQEISAVAPISQKGSPSSEPQSSTGAASAAEHASMAG